MTMIERVAMAIYAESYKRCCNGEAPDAGDESWKSYRGEAKAALGAMREPSPEVLHVISMCSTVGDWQEMIDAALSTKP